LVGVAVKVAALGGRGAAACVHRGHGDGIQRTRALQPQVADWRDTVKFHAVFSMGSFWENMSGLHAPALHAGTMYARVL
jgi:hypothetical protein